MLPLGPLAQVVKPLFTAGLAFSCLGVVAAVVAVTLGLLRALPHQAQPDLQGVVTALVALAAFCYVMAAFSLWSLVRPAAAPSGAGGSRPVSRRGTVVLDGEPLRSPLTGTPCAAYLYRLYRHVVRDGDRVVIWAYNGMGSAAFSLDLGGGRTVAVRAVPRLMDEPELVSGPHALARARRYVASNRFTPADGVLGGVGLAATIVSDLAQRSVQPGAPYRCDWANSQESSVDLARLQFEEVLLPVGATVTVVGHWLQAQGAIVPSELAQEPAMAAATPDGADAIRAALQGASLDEPEVRRGSVGHSITGAVVMVAFGSGALALSRLL